MLSIYFSLPVLINAVLKEGKEKCKIIQKTISSCCDENSLYVQKLLNSYKPANYNKP